MTASKGFNNAFKLNAFDNVMSPLYGAKGNGTDDSAAFTAAASAGRLVVIPKPPIAYAPSNTITTVSAAWLPDPTLAWATLTNSGKLDMHRGHFTGAGNGVNIWRFEDRVFIGEAASKWAAVSDVVPDAGTSWFSSDTNGPAFLGVNAQLLVTSPEKNDSGGRYAIVGAAKTSANTGTDAIAVSGAVINAKASGTAWGLYSDLAAQGTSGITIGLEVAAKNQRSGDTTMSPNAQVSGVFGLWLAGGGDSAYGGPSTFPSTAALAVIKNTNTWNTGIVMMADALTSGRAMALSSVGSGVAHYLGWYNALSVEVFTFKSTATSGAIAWSLTHDDNGLYFLKAGKTLFQSNGSASAVNGLLVYGDVAGSSPQLIAQGDDTNIDLMFTPKGSGVIKFGTFTGSGDVVCNGSITIKDAAGNTRKLMTTA